MIDGSSNGGNPQFTRLYVAIGSDADLGAHNCEVRFTPLNGHRAAPTPCPKSANKRLMHCNNWPLYWKPSGTSNATTRHCLRGLPGGEPAASEGDYFTY
jgi:hypothetical protein